MNRCQQIKKRIRDLQAQLAKREAQLIKDRYDLFHRAYAVNPGGDMAGKGTYLGHVDMISSIKRGITKLEARAWVP